MKSVSFAFLVILYLICTHINCDVNSNRINDTKSIFNRTSDIFYRNGAVFLPLTLTEKNSTIESLEIDFVEAVSDQEALAKKCLKNMTECMKLDHLSRDFSYLRKTLLSSVFSSDLSKIPGVSSKCRHQSKRYLEELAQFKFWALKIFDSNAKLPSGLLSGNVNQFGDFDICLQANSLEDNIYGQYCLASFQIEAPNNLYLAALHRLLQSHYHFKSNMEDPGHRVPRYSTINWAFCIPDGCTSEDLEKGIEHKMLDISKQTDLNIAWEVQPSMCQTSRPKFLPLSTIMGMSFFVCFVTFVGFATLHDYIAIENANQFIVAFSLRKNLNSLVTINKKDDIKVVHGIRFLNSLLLLLSHKSMAIFYVPYHNRTEMVEFIAKPWTVLARAASLYTDPFIMIAGTLTAYSMFGKLEKFNKINIKDEYISRMFRIVPTFAAVIAFCTFVLPWLDSGPMWNQVVTHHSDICKQNWWRNLMFIHNYFGFGDMCLTHTHHIGIDTQLFFTSPFLVLLLWKYPKRGLLMLFSLAAVSTFLRYNVTYNLRLNNYIHFGTSIKQLFDTADNMYILPVHRATVYIMGIILGYLLRKMKQFRLSKVQVRFGNSIASLSFLASFLGPSFMGSIDYVYNPIDAAWYAAFAPILWCIAFGWIIFSTHVGVENMVGRFFSWPGFSLWTKISYTVYLTQFPIFFYNVGTTKAAEHYSFWRTNINLHEMLCIIAASTLLTLLFEMPFQNIRNILLNRSKHKSIKPDPSHHEKNT